MASSGALIVGAGPTGLVLALWLAKLGVKMRIIDKTAEPGTTSRAVAVQARALELYRQLDLAETVVEKGHKVPAVNLWASLSAMTWQVHVYGTAAGALYLLRPDTYVALADPTGSPQALERYFADRKITPGR